jgi:O-acetyl-ADP-ribose deacetylase (regulator of RNase III)
MRLHLVDVDPLVVAAWRREFQPFPEVEVCQGSILAVARGAVVSPANGYGFMDGGVDRAYAMFFGPALERRVRDVMARQPEGFLPVGAAVIVATGHERIQHVILAPTMLMPEHVPAAHAYRALRAVLRLAVREGGLGDIFCPGLATGVGGVSPSDAAREMAAAYVASGGAKA